MRVAQDVFPPELAGRPEFKNVSPIGHPQAVKVTVDGGHRVRRSSPSAQGDFAPRPAQVEWVSEVNYKFKLSAFAEPLLSWLSKPGVIVPASR
jgi:hypothetical protein